MNKAIICGYYGQGNAGDEALLLAILARLPQHIQPLVLSANPGKTSQDYGVVCYSRKDIIKQIFVLGKDDSFIWGGGSLIQDITSIKSPLYYLSLMFLAQLKGLKTIAYAQGIGPIKTPLINWLTKIILQKCDRVSVRDKASAKLLEDWKIKYLIAADPVWALPSKMNSNLDLLPYPRIAVNLRSHHLLTTDKIAVLAKALKQLQKQIQANIILVPFQRSQDLSVCEEIAQQLSSNYQIIYLENPQELKGLWQEIDMMIGMRLHSIIMAASEKCPCFALSYDPKVSNLMQEVGIEGYDLARLPNNFDEIAKTWSKFYDDRAPLSDKIIESLAQNALEHQHLIDSLIA